MSDLDIPILERPAFFDGQRLTAADLAAVQQFHRELRWLHNRSLHNWGIAIGCAVSGVRGERTVRVQPGYALDCKGRELILSKSLEVPTPAVAGINGGPATYYLTASYADDADLTPEIRSGTCGAAGAVRRAETPIIRWQEPNDTNIHSRYRRGLDIILASIQVQNCQLAKDVSGAERRDAMPAQQPYIAAGQTLAGKTSWRLWPECSPMGVATTVVTTAAGFRSTPRYQAHVVGSRIFNGQVGGSRRSFVVDGYAQIANATASSFELQVILPGGATAGESQIDRVTKDDYFLVLERIAENWNIPEGHRDTFKEYVLKSFGQRLYVGQRLSLIRIMLPLPSPFYIVQPDDFGDALDAIAARNGVSVDTLKAVNGLTPETMSLTIYQDLKIPGPALDLNPPDVLTASFVTKLQEELGWYVVWMGVEG